MTGVRLTTNAYPHDQRLQAWRFALQRVSLQLASGDEDIYGDLVSFTSGQKIQFVRCMGTAQALTLDFRQEAQCFWLVLLLEGRLSAAGADRAIGIGEGDMIYGSGDTPCRIAAEGDFRLLLVKVPHSLPALKSRLQLPTGIRDVFSDTAVGRLMSSLLRTVADIILDISDDQIRPVELALPEMIAATVFDRMPARQSGGAAGGAASGRGAILDRVFQSIEMRLSDPNLNTHRVAADHNISPRYLQKLFEAQGDSFGHYVKLRRLERCRLDLGSPLHAQRSISDILLQWGFNDSASFSRAFRAQYGVSPREYRKTPEIAGAPPTAGKTRGDEVPAAPAATAPLPLSGDSARSCRHHSLPALPATIHRGVFNRSRRPALQIRSGDRVTIETLTHHASDDAERMTEADSAAEAIEREGPGERCGVPICTGPIAVEGAMPGDLIEVRILDMQYRGSRNPRFAGRAFGSAVAVDWSRDIGDRVTGSGQPEVVTIYEFESGPGTGLSPGHATARALHSYRRASSISGSNAVRESQDYPYPEALNARGSANGTTPHDLAIPVRPHFGVIALAPAHPERIDVVPPAHFCGAIDNRRLGAGASAFLPVDVAGGLLSIGDPHASPGDSGLCGSAIRCSMTAEIQVFLHPAGTGAGHMRNMDHPLIETRDEWVIPGFSVSERLDGSIEAAMRDARGKARRFLMALRDLGAQEANALLPVSVNFDIGRAANGNWHVGAVIKKSLFAT